MNLKENLLSTNEFIDNEYLDLYVKLISDNMYTVREKGKTQLHHILPKCYFSLNNLDYKKEKNNTVNLLYSDHVRAHCYIVLSSRESKFKYLNLCAIYKAASHRDFIDLKDFMLSLPEVQKAYEGSRDVAIANNPMNIKEHREHHGAIMGTEEVRNKISNSMKEYRQTHPFTEEHRKNLSLSAMGNHNWGNPDTRSVNCFCVDEFGEVHYFHNYLIAGKWWYENYAPFGDGVYSACTFQRKIKQSIEHGYATYRKSGMKEQIYIDNIKWFKGGDSNEVN